MEAWRPVFVVVLLVFAVAGVPHVERRPVPTDAPVGDLLGKVAPVAVVLSGADDVDRALWAEVWEKAGAVADAETSATEPFLTNTQDMRTFTVAMTELAWNRLRGKDPAQYPGLQKAIEEFLADPAVLGRDEVIADAKYLARYSAACRALAYAGRKRG